MKTYYALENQHGIRLTLDSIGWHVLRFASKKERDDYVDEHRRDACGNLITLRCNERLASKVYRLMRCQCYVAENGIERSY